MVGLKRSVIVPVADFDCAGFNRTMVGLKQLDSGRLYTLGRCFNRTMVGLKRLTHRD